MFKKNVIVSIFLSLSLFNGTSYAMLNSSDMDKNGGSRNDIDSDFILRYNKEKLINKYNENILSKVKNNLNISDNEKIVDCTKKFKEDHDDLNLIKDLNSPLAYSFFSLFSEEGQNSWNIPISNVYSSLASGDLTKIWELYHNLTPEGKRNLMEFAMRSAIYFSYVNTSKINNKTFYKKLFCSDWKFLNSKYLDTNSSLPGTTREASTQTNYKADLLESLINKF